MTSIKAEAAKGPDEALTRLEPKRAHPFPGCTDVVRVGGGSFGDVYGASEEASGRRVAIKVMKEQYAENAELVERFKREGAVLKQVQHHPCVPEFIRDGMAGKRYYMITEFAEGVDLSTHVAAGPLAVVEVVKITAQLAGVLEHLQRRGIVNRDIKCENFRYLRTNDGDPRIKLVDYGTAVASNLPDLTPPNFFIGTPKAASAEQFRGGARPEASWDVRAGGVVVYELLTGGRRPLEARSSQELARKVVDGTPHVPIVVYRKGLPAELIALVDGMLNPDPDKRLTATQVQERTQALLRALCPPPSAALRCPPADVESPLRHPPVAQPSARPEAIAPIATVPPVAPQTTVAVDTPAASPAVAPPVAPLADVGSAARRPSRRVITTGFVTFAAVAMMVCWAMLSPTQPPPGETRPYPSPQAPDASAREARIAGFDAGAQGGEPAAAGASPVAGTPAPRSESDASITPHMVTGPSPARPRAPRSTTMPAAGADTAIKPPVLVAQQPPSTPAADCPVAARPPLLPAEVSENDIR